MRSCLLVVDAQEGFRSPLTEPVLVAIRDLLLQNVFDRVLFTRFQNLPGSPHQTLLNWHMMQTPKERAIVRDLQPFVELTIEKPGYSAVTLALEKFLSAECVSDVFVCGLDTDCCVLKTAADLFEQGISVFVLGDYCASNGGARSHEAGLLVLGRLIGRDRVILGPVNASSIRLAQTANSEVNRKKHEDPNGAGPTDGA